LKRLLIILPVLAFLYSCESKFPEFTEKEEGIYYQLLSFEEGELSYKPNKYVVAGIKIFDGDSIVFRNYKEQIVEPKDNQFGFLFRHLTKGDSASFMIKTSRLEKEIPLFKASEVKSEYVKVFVKVYDYLPELKKIEDPEMSEQVLLKKYLKEYDITTKKGPIYIQQISSGKGIEIKKGSTISIHYKGYFINCLQFDNTYKKMDFTFTYGTPGQVIKGIDIALKGMKKGEKSKLIIPSQFAFGEVGSTTQIIPPYTTVIYELEIVNVK
jgi:FKBP-type peptidyl-prolyl cis-trans isomerase